MDVRAVDEDLGKRAGELLGRAKKSDVVDAALVLLAARAARRIMELIPA